MTAEVNGEVVTASALLRQARNAWKRDQPQAALDLAWDALALAPNDRSAKELLARLLQTYPANLHGERRADYLRLLTDREVEPNLINKAGWQLLLRSHPLAEDAGDVAVEALIADIECDELALALLREAPVSFAPAERLVTRLRRWLLLTASWRRHPAIAAVLQAQAGLNGGAWPFDETECALLGQENNSPMIAGYVPMQEGRTGATRADPADPVTRAVAAQYEGWPYPAWTRVTVHEGTRLPDVIAPMDTELAKALPIDANMLIAGCGTGRQAVSVALQYPDAMVTAIDVSEASLAYARRQSAALGVSNVRFLRLDLHDVADLGPRFHAVHCGGVLHHLPDPERGLKLLAGVLHPGGVMHIMVYNRHQRLLIAGARTFLIADLVKQPMSDDLLRRVRQRFLEQPDNPAAAYVVRSPDFATLAGTHDLVLHRHEDPFDLPRIERAVNFAGLRMLSFDMPSPPIGARYDAMFPDDPTHRDINSLTQFELREPSMLRRNYQFWCYAPLH